MKNETETTLRPAQLHELRQILRSGGADTASMGLIRRGLVEAIVTPDGLRCFATAAGCAAVRATGGWS